MQLLPIADGTRRQQNGHASRTMAGTGIWRDATTSRETKTGKPSLIQIHFFAGLREQAGTSQLDWPWTEGFSAGLLRSQLTLRWPGIEVLLKRSTLAVNNQIVPDSFLIPDHAEVALLPPVSGG